MWKAPRDDISWVPSAISWCHLFSASWLGRWSSEHTAGVMFFLKKNKRRPKWSATQLASGVICNCPPPPESRRSTAGPLTLSSVRRCLPNNPRIWVNHLAVTLPCSVAITVAELHTCCQACIAALPLTKTKGWQHSPLRFTKGNKVMWPNDFSFASLDAGTARVLKAFAFFSCPADPASPFSSHVQMAWPAWWSKRPESEHISLHSISNSCSKSKCCDMVAGLMSLASSAVLVWILLLYNCHSAGAVSRTHFFQSLYIHSIVPAKSRYKSHETSLCFASSMLIIPRLRRTILYIDSLISVGSKALLLCAISSTCRNKSLRCGIERIPEPCLPALKRWGAQLTFGVSFWFSSSNQVWYLDNFKRFTRYCFSTCSAIWKVFSSPTCTKCTASKYNMCSIWAFCRKKLGVAFSSFFCQGFQRRWNSARDATLCSNCGSSSSFKSGMREGSSGGRANFSSLTGLLNSSCFFSGVWTIASLLFCCCWDHAACCDLHACCSAGDMDFHLERAALPDMILESKSTPIEVATFW